jgi:hypothetical protein
VRDSNERHDAVAEFGLGTNTLVSDRYAGRVGVPYRVTLCALPDAENVANAGRILDGELGGPRVSHAVFVLFDFEHLGLVVHAHAVPAQVVEQVHREEVVEVLVLTMVPPEVARQDRGKPIRKILELDLVRFVWIHVRRAFLYRITSIPYPRAFHSLSSFIAISEGMLASAAATTLRPERNLALVTSSRRRRHRRRSPVRPLHNKTWLSSACLPALGREAATIVLDSALARLRSNLRSGGRLVANPLLRAMACQASQAARACGCMARRMIRRGAPPQLHPACPLLSHA